MAGEEEWGIDAVSAVSEQTESPLATEKTKRPTNLSHELHTSEAATAVVGGEVEVATLHEVTTIGEAAGNEAQAGAEAEEEADMVRISRGGMDPRVFRSRTFPRSGSSCYRRRRRLRRWMTGPLSSRARATLALGRIRSRRGRRSRQRRRQNWNGRWVKGANKLETISADKGGIETKTAIGPCTCVGKGLCMHAVDDTKCDENWWSSQKSSQ